MSYETKIQDVIANTPETVEQTSLIKLSTGVILASKKFSIMRIQAVLAQFPYPEVPAIEDKERGRIIRNPDSPFYLEQKAQVDQNRLMAIMDAVIAFGTTIKYIPEGMEGPEGDEWVEELELINIPVRKDIPLARYQAWVKFVAAPDLEDITKITEQFGVQMGTSEVKITNSIRENFPG